MSFTTINPTTAKPIKTYQELTEIELEQALAKSQSAFLEWKQQSYSKRASCFQRLAHLLNIQVETLARLITNEMGKPIQQSRSEINKCAWACEHYAEQTAEYLQPRLIETDMSKTQVSYQPLGVVLAIMPWNFPFWQVFRCAAPTLMAGNAMILKHAPISIGSGEQIAALFREAGFPEFLFQHVIINNDATAKVIAHPNVRALSFTGSEQTGRIVGASAASHLKKSVLELGGSDPYLVLHDADIDIAALAIVSSRLNNCGQVCIAAKRVIVDKRVYTVLLDAITELMSTYIMADPHQESTLLGPMARQDLRDKVHQQVMNSQNQGARLLIGGQIPEGNGFYYPATLLTDVVPGMTAFDEELFGPVIGISVAKDEEEAIKLANTSQYGLGAAVFTRDLERGEKIAKEAIEAGSCFVNTFVASDPRVPFGGIKQSGYGRELSREGILEFVNVKTVAVK